MRMGLMLLGLVLLAGCASGLAPNGMSWDEYHAAKYRLKIVYRAEAVADCQQLGLVRGSAYDDIGDSKDDAAERAVMIGANTLLIQKLWSDEPVTRLFNRRELHYAEGTAYRCAD